MVASYSKLTPAQKLRRWAWSLITTPIVMLFPLALGPFIEPSALIDHYDLYLLFYGLPFSVALLLFMRARRLERAGPDPTASA